MNLGGGRNGWGLDWDVLVAVARKVLGWGWGAGIRVLGAPFSSGPRSPISSLPALFDQTTSAPCAGGQLDSTAPGTTNMEQLLEKQGDGEAGVNSEQGCTGRGGLTPCPSPFPRTSSLFTGLA